jgi:Cu-Zn family superoxide dismutase
MEGVIVRKLNWLGIAVLGVCAVAGTSAQEPAGTAGTAAPAATASAASSLAATASLMDAKGQSIGEARFQPTPSGVLLRLELKNASPGVHAMHIHAVGRCDAPAFTSAGSHLNAGGKQHGFLNASGPHPGDLPNIEIPASGQLSLEHHIADVALDKGAAALLDSDGAALVIHAAKDDYATDPAGAAGDRIACGAIRSQK